MTQTERQSQTAELQRLVDLKNFANLLQRGGIGTAKDAYPKKFNKLVLQAFEECNYFGQSNPFNPQ